MITKTIVGLNPEQQGILKQIIIVGQGDYNEITVGSLFYKRPFSSTYNMAKQAEADNKEEDRFARYLKGYPQQENYPEDIIDSIILDAVKRQYPKSFVRSYLLLFNVDLENLATLKNKRRVESHIFLMPTFSEPSDINRFVGKEFSAPVISVNIYTDYSTDRVTAVNFFGNYPAESDHMIKLLDSVTFE